MGYGVAQPDENYCCPVVTVNLISVIRKVVFEQLRNPRLKEPYPQWEKPHQEKFPRIISESDSPPDFSHLEGLRCEVENVKHAEHCEKVDRHYQFKCRGGGCSLERQRRELAGNECEERESVYNWKDDAEFKETDVHACPFRHQRAESPPDRKQPSYHGPAAQDKHQQEQGGSNNSRPHIRQHGPHEKELQQKRERESEHEDLPVSHLQE